MDNIRRESFSSLALKNMSNNALSKYISVKDINYGHPVEVSFSIQNGTVKDTGLHGCQVREILEFSIKLLKELDKEFPCRENAISLTHMETALLWQDKRTQGRQKRGVEGKNEI